MTSLPVNAAQITVASRGQFSVVSITGEFNLSDGAEFAERVAKLNRTVVVLNSIGGNLLAGIRIGNVIRLKGFATAVRDGQICASACAVAWLGGVVRYMGVDARIGFHAAFDRETGEETGVGNALVGSYLNRLGLSDEVVVYVTIASPNQIQWLTMPDALKLGIGVGALPDANALEGGTPLPPADSPSGTPTHNRGESRRSAAISFANDYFAHWSDSNAAAIGYFGRIYSDSVKFAERSISRDSLMAEKRKFAERWPERLYSARPKTIQAECDETARTCSVTGLIDWDCRNSQRPERSAGVAKFTLQIAVPDEGEIRVVGEWGTVISQSSGTGG
jgi:hypothetical protein